MTDWDGYGFETRAIHAGQEPEAGTGAVAVPIYQMSTYAQSGVGEHKGYEYSRTGNPTRTALETCLASLEGARFGRCFASGMAAEDAILRRLPPGSNIALPKDAYGGTFRLVSKIYAPTGYSWSSGDDCSQRARLACARQAAGSRSRFSSFRADVASTSVTRAETSWLSGRTGRLSK
jgi:cystathionine gamma-synthase